MVLEYLIGMEEKNYLHIFFLGVIFSTVAIFLASSLFATAPSMVFVVFMSIPCIYILGRILNRESLEEVNAKGLKEIFKTNFDLIEIFLFLFLGMCAGTAIWFSILPQQTLSSIFSEQIGNLKQLGHSTALATGSEVLKTIILNNARLVLLCVILSFVFGSGAIFILTWNASVVGSAIGLLIYKLRVGGTIAANALLQGIGKGIGFYIIHLVPEAVAYFYASVAGAFISSAMIRYKPFSPNSSKLLMVAGIFVLTALVLVLIGGLLEVYVSFPIQANFK